MSEGGDGDHTRGIKHGENIKELQRERQQIRDNALAIAKIQEKLEKDKPTFWSSHAKLIIGAALIVFLVLMGFNAGDIRELIGV